MHGTRWAEGSVVGRAGWASLALWAALLAGCTPIYTWDTNTVSRARAPSLDVAELTREPVATAGIVAPANLQGFNAPVSHALAAALAGASPPLRSLPAYETLNALTDRDLAADYADLLGGFARSGILERERLQRIGSALGAGYLLLPGLAEISQTVLDKFELAGFKIVRTRVTVVRLWLQLWDTRTGHMVWEASGEIATASNTLRIDRLVPVDVVAQRLWRRMIQQDLLRAP